MNISKVAFFVVLSVFFSHAEAMTVSVYQSLKEKDREALEFYMEGVGQGVTWTHSMFSTIRNAEVFCLPNKLGLNAQNYIHIVDRRYSFIHRKVGQLSLILLLRCCCFWYGEDISVRVSDTEQTFISQTLRFVAAAALSASSLMLYIFFCNTLITVPKRV